MKGIPIEWEITLAKMEGMGAHLSDGEKDGLLRVLAGFD
jgi:hypothetical protein